MKIIFTVYSEMGKREIRLEKNPQPESSNDTHILVGDYNHEKELKTYFVSKSEVQSIFDIADKEKVSPIEISNFMYIDGKGYSLSFEEDFGFNKSTFSWGMGSCGKGWSSLWEIVTRLEKLWFNYNGFHYGYL